MKLRNKKTGEIEEFEDITKLHRFVGSQNIYGSLAELCEEWEDYEEPTYYYFIQDDGRIGCDAIEPYNHKPKVVEHKEIGNYFETKEEAEKAVEKLKAWKRLKDKGFRFAGWNKRYCDEINYRLDTTEDMSKDLDLLFGGKE